VPVILQRVEDFFIISGVTKARGVVGVEWNLERVHIELYGTAPLQA